MTTLQECSAFHKQRAAALTIHLKVIGKDLGELAVKAMNDDIAMHTRFCAACEEASVPIHVLSNEPRSHCCNAEMEVRSGMNDGTNYYVCNHCQRSCDPK